MEKELERSSEKKKVWALWWMWWGLPISHLFAPTSAQILSSQPKLQQPNTPSQSHSLLDSIVFILETRRPVQFAPPHPTPRAAAASLPASRLHRRRLLRHLCRSRVPLRSRSGRKPSPLHHNLCLLRSLR